MATPPPLERRTDTYAGRSVDVLRGMVRDGQLQPGQRLNEVELARALGISRGPLREAIQRLASEGLLAVVPHRGAYVRTFDAGELRDLYELRTALETHAVRLAARRADTEDLRDLEELLRATEEVLESDVDTAYPNEFDFHHRVVALSGNQSMLRAFADANNQIQLARSRSGRQPRRARDAFQEHREVVRAIAEGDAELAARLLGEHLQHSLDNALALFDTSVPDSPGGLAGRIDDKEL
ncbi:GntR family transcriptional regulator [Amycolatopsis rhabdoformis]|uniref:GntR family transcriptional regulator n=1 Tax=Amycolatopsis rhabdoformis TaxID=1448059 RepID=A0ABZ1HWQ9_9PSEU|nr:GntR family transcriptional regulator [Amycolatopsis rhabdoformis]WSE26637.1 GntR family transcriptional regulator [Amycolatopsis rhabdoformis]